MTDESPLDLRSLGDVESPEVVRAALRRFRRNALRTAAWVAVVGLVAVTFALGASARRSLGTLRAEARMSTIQLTVVYQGASTAAKTVRINRRAPRMTSFSASRTSSAVNGSVTDRRTSWRSRSSAVIVDSLFVNE